MAIGVGSRQAGGDFRAIDRLGDNLQMLRDRREIKTGIVEDFKTVRAGEESRQIGRVIGLAVELDEMGGAVAGAQLDEAERIARRF